MADNIFLQLQVGGLDFLPHFQRLLPGIGVVLTGLLVLDRTIGVDVKIVTVSKVKIIVVENLK